MDTRMARTHVKRALLIFALALSTCAAGAQEYRARIEELINAPVYRYASWGILVVDAKSGEKLYALNEDKMIRPASVTKLFTVAAALEALGPDYRFHTPVYRMGDVDSGGTLTGDLILVASGDPTMGGRAESAGIAFRNVDHIYSGFTEGAEVTDTDPAAGLKSLARQIKRTGIRRVNGDIIIDDRLFDSAGGTGSGPSKLTPIVVNDNLVDVIVSPGETGGPAKVRWIPESEAVHVESQVVTGPADGATSVVLSSTAPDRI